MTSAYIEYAKHCIGLDHKEPCRRYSKLYYRPYRNYYDASREDCEIRNVMVAAGYAEAGEKDKHGGRMYKMTREGLTWLGKKLGIVIHDMEE